MQCEKCKAALSRDSQRLAEEIAQQFPECECEQYSVGRDSPGRIEDYEVLYRMFTDPVDVDEGKLARNAFRTAHIDGLSIIRDCADNTQFAALVSDILSVKPGKKPKSILAIFRFVCSTVRTQKIDVNCGSTRLFCVYDQTIPRVLQPQEPPVKCHGIILSTRISPTPKPRKQVQLDCEAALYEIVAADPIPVDDFRGGLILDLNERSLLGEFVRT